MQKSFLSVIAVILIVFFGFFILLAASAFGIWLSADSGIRDVMAEINREYVQQLQEIRENADPDDVVMSGSQADWRTVLAVYAVIATSAEEDPMDVVTMDDAHAALLREVFWSMNRISWHTESVMVPVDEADASDTALALMAVISVSPTYQVSPLKIDFIPITPVDPVEPTGHSHSYTTYPVDATCTEGGYTLYLCDCGHSYKSGYISALGHMYSSRVVSPTVESEGYTEHTCTRCGDSYRDNYTDKLPSETEPSMVEYVTLYIEVSNCSALEIADTYGFTEEQIGMLEELLRDENRLMWNDVIYGISSGGNTDILSVAATQLGNYNGMPYKNWYGVPSDTAWCAIFVSWCAKESGYIASGIIPQFSLCTVGAAWFQEHGQWLDAGSAPSAGDLIFFDWEQDDYIDHVGLVEYVEDGYVYTIEGNRSNAVGRYSYSLDSKVIDGYGCPDYDSTDQNTSEGSADGTRSA